MTMLAFVAFTIVREHGGRFLSSSMSLLHICRPCQVPTLCLRFTQSFVGMAFFSSSIAFLLVLSKFWLAWCILGAVEQEPQVILDGKLVVSSSKCRQVEIEDILTWTEAFTVFHMMLCAVHPHHWPDMTMY